MEKMRDPPFVEQALNLIKRRGLLVEMSEFERVNACASDWEGCGQSITCRLLLVLLRLFSGSLGPPPCLALGLHPLLCKQIFHENEEFFLSHLRPHLQSKPHVGKELFPQHSPDCWPAGGGTGTGKTWGGRERGRHPGGKSE